MHGELWHAATSFEGQIKCVQKLWGNNGGSHLTETLTLGVVSVAATVPNWTDVRDEGHLSFNFIHLKSEPHHLKRCIRPYRKRIRHLFFINRYDKWNMPLRRPKIRWFYLVGKSGCFDRHLHLTDASVPAHSRFRYR
jgi:hypothetical protein